jgi:hypothetical protein
MEMDDMNEMYEKKANYFYNQKKFIHVELKNGKFYNGEIIDVSSDFFNLHDRIVGEIPIFYSEINIFEPFTFNLKKEEK